MKEDQALMITAESQRLIAFNIHMGLYTDERLYQVIDVLSRRVPLFLTLRAELRGFVVDAVARDLQQHFTYHPETLEVQPDISVVVTYLKYSGLLHPTTDWSTFVHQVFTDADMESMHSCAHMVKQLTDLPALGYTIH